jgi:ABC-type branched-subunit amino acid transport system substrate-binding protein
MVDRFSPLIKLSALALLACFGAAHAEPGVTPTSVLIGQTIARTGGLAEHGNAVMLGIRAHIESVNAAGGIHGRKIVLKTLDDEGNAEKAAKNTQELIDTHDAFITFGGVEGGPCVASMKVAAGKKVPLVGCMAGSPELREPYNRYVFPVRAPHFSEFAKIIELSKVYGYTRYGFLHADSETGRKHMANVNRLLLRLNLPTATALPYKPGTDGKPDLQGMARSIADAKLQLVFNHGSYADFATIYREARKLGATTHFMAINSGAAQMARLLGKDARGMVFTQVVPYPWRDATPVVREYQAALKKLDPNAEYSFSSLEGYISAKVMTEGVRHTGKWLTRDRLIAAMETFDELDLGGVKVSYTPQSHTGALFVDTVVVASDGRFVH